MMCLAVPFSARVGNWAGAPDGAGWRALQHAALVRPLEYVHVQAWAPMPPAARRCLRDSAPLALVAQTLWDDYQARCSVPLFHECPAENRIGQLVLVCNRREILTLALWAGASLARRLVAGAVARSAALRWQSRLGSRLYREVLAHPLTLGECRPLPAANEWTAGRMMLDLGLEMLARWAGESLQPRLQSAAGPHQRPASHYLGEGGLRTVDAGVAAPLLLAFVAREAHVEPS